METPLKPFKNQGRIIEEFPSSKQKADILKKKKKKKKK